MHKKEKKKLPKAGIESWTSWSTVGRPNHCATEHGAVLALQILGSIVSLSFWPFLASKRPQRVQMTSELDSVTSITYVATLFWALNAFIWVIDKRWIMIQWPAGFAAGKKGDWEALPRHKCLVSGDMLKFLNLLKEDFKAANWRGNEEAQICIKMLLSRFSYKGWHIKSLPRFWYYITKVVFVYSVY